MFFVQQLQKEDKRAIKSFKIFLLLVDSGEDTK